MNSTFYQNNSNSVLSVLIILSKWQYQKVYNVKVLWNIKVSGIFQFDGQINTCIRVFTSVLWPRPQQRYSHPSLPELSALHLRPEGPTIPAWVDRLFVELCSNVLCSVECWVTFYVVLSFMLYVVLCYVKCWFMMSVAFWLSVGWPEGHQNNSLDWAGYKPVISCSPGAPQASSPSLAWTDHLTSRLEALKPSLLTCRTSPSSSLRCQQTSGGSSSKSWIRNCRRRRDSGISSALAAIAPVWVIAVGWAWSYQVRLDFDLPFVRLYYCGDSSNFSVRPFSSVLSCRDHR